MAFDFNAWGVWGKQAPKTIDFNATFGHFGIFSRVPPPRIQSFITSVERQIARLNKGTPPSSGDWFKVEDDKVSVSLRFRGRIVPLLNGSNMMKLPSREIAIAYLQASINTANDGLFDEVFDTCINTKSRTKRKDDAEWAEIVRVRTPEEVAATKEPKA